MHAILLGLVLLCMLDVLDVLYCASLSIVRCTTSQSHHALMLRSARSLVFCSASTSEQTNSRTL